MGAPQPLAYERDLAIQARIVRHIQETASPETAPDLVWTKPPRGQDYTIIWKFDLPQAKRPDGEMVRCPICSGDAPKFYEGALAWFQMEGVYRVIGRQCAKHGIGAAQAERAEREYR